MCQFVIIYNQLSCKYLSKSVPKDVKVKPKWVYNQMGFRKRFFTGIIFCLQTGMKEIKQNSVGPRDPEMKTESENIRA